MLKFKLRLRTQYSKTEYDYYVCFNDYATLGIFIDRVAGEEWSPTIIGIEKVKEEENNAVH